jgi:hypothetical protein
VTSEQEEELQAFAYAVAEQSCMPLYYRLLAWGGWLSVGRGSLLRVFLVSRWDLIQADPRPRRWAREFVSRGGPKRVMAFLACVMALC